MGNYAYADDPGANASDLSPAGFEVELEAAMWALAHLASEPLAPPAPRSPVVVRTDAHP